MHSGERGAKALAEGREGDIEARDRINHQPAHHATFETSDLEFVCTTCMNMCTHHTCEFSTLRMVPKLRGEWEERHRETGGENPVSA